MELTVAVAGKHTNWPHFVHFTYFAFVFGKLRRFISVEYIGGDLRTIYSPPVEIHRDGGGSGGSGGRER